MNRTTEFDKLFKKNISHYKRHKQMIPFVGKHWGKYKKLLIIGESHYLPPESKKSTIENWYELKTSDLNEAEIDFTETADLVENGGDHQQYDSKGHTIYKNIEDAILESGFKPENTVNMFQYVSFMNFFQRPAQNTGKSIIHNDEDVVIANTVLKGVCSIIKPDYIYFVSSMIHPLCDEIEGVTVGHSCHPACSWWNRKVKHYSLATQKTPLTGKENFIKFIKHHKIFA